MPRAPLSADAARHRHAGAASEHGERIAYFDRLKVLLIGAIIAGHGVMGYSDVEGAWPYQEIQEVALGEVSEGVLWIVVLPAVLFAMGLFFLISGLLTPRPIDRKGAQEFARDRLVRLGLPLVIWVFVLWPASMSAMHRATGDPRPYWWELVHADPVLDTGPMWFVEVLLIYSLAYAAWRRWGSHRAQRVRAAPAAVSAGRARSLGWTLVTLAAGISITTMLVRLAFPIASGQIGQLHLWQWPQYLALFGLGIVAARRGWLDPVPSRIRHACGLAALLAIAAFVGLGAAVAAAGLEPDAFTDLRMHWAPLGLAAIEGPLAVGASVWLLAFAQRHLDRPPDRRTRALSRSAYAAFILQAPVLIGLALALRPLDVPAEIKAVGVAAAAVGASFTLAWLLIRRTPLGRIL